MRVEEKIPVPKSGGDMVSHMGGEEKGAHCPPRLEPDLEKARAEKDHGEIESLEEQRHWETSEYEDKILANTKQKAFR